MKPTPINMAEAIFEPFWDPQLSGLAQWTVEPEAHGLKVRQNWCWVTFEWARKPAAGPALRMWRKFDLDCSGYDHLLLSVMAPEGSILRVTATTDRGTLRFFSPPAPKLKQEHTIDLQGASRIDTITLEVEAAEDGVALGWFNWLGLQNAELLLRYLAEWERFDEAWEGYLQPESYEPRFEPALGLLIGADELAKLRQQHDAFLRAHGTSPFVQAAAEAEKLVPERMVGEFVNFWGDTRYNRERDHGKHLLTHGPNAALAGLLLRDKRLLRLGARYAMALAMCRNWDDGMITRFPGSTFHHVCFVQSLCVHEAALILDWAGELFTPLGRDLLLRRIAEEGQGTINYCTWRHEYIFHCNQLAWFTPGRMAGYALLERFWPRVCPYTERAYQDLVESLGYAILPDGGYVEGPTYFRCVGRDGGLSLAYYARARGLKLGEILSEPMKRTAPFAALIASTDENADHIPICDAVPLAEQECLAVMAAALPQSQWVNLFRKSLARTGGLPTTVLACQLEPEIPAQGPEPEPFVRLPEMGPIASTRKLGDEWVKILVQGNKAGAGHTHEDKGGFVLEFAGQTFALDPGTCDYSSPLADILPHCERHNMLVPTGLAERPHPQSPLRVDVKPQGEGDATRFHAEIDVTPGWEGYYRKWIRVWDSPTPDILTITDDYELAQGDGVAFYWQTQREVQVTGRTITLTGERGRVMIQAPEDCAVQVEALPLLGGAVQTRIAMLKKGRAGRLTIAVTLELRQA